MRAAIVPENKRNGVPFGTSNRWAKMCVRVRGSPRFEQNQYRLNNWIFQITWTISCVIALITINMPA